MKLKQIEIDSFKKYYAPNTLNISSAISIFVTTTLRWNKNFLTAFIDNHLIHYPTSINLSYAWSFGSAAGICLVIQILSGIFLAMHYTPHIDLAFSSVEHIMRDVNNGWLIRYVHANGASMFFIVVYCHIFRGLYYGSYMHPRQLLWCSGVIIFILMMGTAFMGYVLPWGQMSFWGATVITSVRGRKASRTSRFQGNNLIPDKGKGELSSFQTAKKILWQLKQGGFNDTWDTMSLQTARGSGCIPLAKYRFVPTPAEESKSSNDLRETIVSFRRTHVTAKQQTQCFAKAEPNIYAEGRPDKTLKNITWRPCVWTPQISHYLKRKGTRLFTVGRIVENHFSTLSENSNLQKNLFLYKNIIDEKIYRRRLKALRRSLRQV
jgi:hypothetical protein